MTKQPEDCSWLTTTNHSLEPAGQENNFTIQPEYKKIFNDKLLLCPYNCYICHDILWEDFVNAVYKRDWILIENDKSIFDPMTEKCE